MAGDYILLGGIKLLYISEIQEAAGLMHLVTEAGRLLFPPNAVLHVV